MIKINSAFAGSAVVVGIAALVAVFTLVPTTQAELACVTSR